MPSFLESVAVIGDGDGRPRGSAFLISNNLLLTAAHVLRDLESPRVRLLDVERFIQSTISNDDLDISILRLRDAKELVMPRTETVSIGFPSTDKRPSTIGGLTPRQFAFCVAITAALNAIPIAELGMPTQAQIVVNGEYASIPLSVMIIVALVHYFNKHLSP